MLSVTLTRRLSTRREPQARLVLPFEARQKSRLRTHLEHGEEVGLLLDRGTVLRGGDQLLASDGRVVEVAAADEDVSIVTAPIRGSSRARPITSATVTSPCRCARARCATCATTSSTTWSAVSASR